MGLLTNEERLRTEGFLKRIRGVLATGEFQIQTNTKNKAFDRKYNLRNKAKKDILRSLTADDCAGIEPNDNPRYPEAEVYKFIKVCRLIVYGEEMDVTLYIKAYLLEKQYYDLVVVISFHEEGMI